MIVGFFFSFRLIITLISVRGFHADAQVGAALGIALNMFLLGWTAFCAFGPADVSYQPILQAACVRWVVGYLCFSVCSLFWTEAMSISAALAYWTAMAADVAIVVFLLRADDSDEVSLSLMKGYVIGSCAVGLLAWVLPAQSDLRLGDEELLGPNQIGYLCAFAIFFAQYLVIKQAPKWGWAAILLAVTLVRSLSKTSIIAFVFGEVLILVFSKTIRRKNKVIIALFVSVGMAAFLPLLEAYYDVYTNAGNQAETLTGRIGIWAVIFDRALDHPWIGHGFHSVWKVIPSFGLFEARHAHNEVLQQFYAYGVVGVLMLAGLYFSLYDQVRKLESQPIKILLFGLLLFVAIRGLTDTEVFDISLPLWAITLLSLSLRGTDSSPSRSFQREESI